jgi:long-chain acyl-CoA synthetase
MFKTSEGNIVHQIIENMMKQSRFIEQIMVIRRSKMPAFIQTNFDFIKEWAALHKFNISTNEEIAANEK